MSGGQVISKRVRFVDTPSKSDPLIQKNSVMNGTRPSVPETDFNQFLSEYIAPQIGDHRARHNVVRPLKLAQPGPETPQGTLSSCPKPSCELELSVFDSSKEVARAKQRLFFAAPRLDSVPASGAGEGMNHSSHPPIPTLRTSKQPEYPFNRQRVSSPSSPLHNQNCCKKSNFKYKTDHHPDNNSVHQKRAEKEIDDNGFFRRQQNLNTPSSKSHSNKNYEFKQIMEPQFLHRSSSSEIIESSHNIGGPEFRFTKKTLKNGMNSTLDYTEVSGHNPVNNGLITAGSRPAMLPVYPENTNEWDTGVCIPEVLPQYLIGYTPDGHGFLYPWNPNRLKEQKTQLCSDNGVNAKVKAIMLHNKDLNDHSQDTLVTQPSVETETSAELTVNDLFEMLKQQNKQLEKLYNKVDMLVESKGMNGHQIISKSPQFSEKEINVHEPNQVLIETQKAVRTDEVQLNSPEVNTIKKHLHQMSIGVMTSFEMVMTSTRQFTEPKVMFPRKSVVCKTEVAVQSKFEAEKGGSLLGNLDPCKDKIVYARRSPLKQRSNIDSILCNVSALSGKSYGTNINEKSFGNVTLNLDKFPSRQMSPEPSMRLEMKDFSGVGSTDISQSERGWTYFNKVVNNVDEILNHPTVGVSTQADFDDNEKSMRLTKKDTGLGLSDNSLCLARRVKFGVESTATAKQPTGLYKHPQVKPITDTSIRIDQLAKKYLKDHPAYHRFKNYYSSAAGMIAGQQENIREVAEDDYSFGTIHGKTQYFEKHQFVIASKDNGKNNEERLREQDEREIHCSPPDKILDIQALKRQPKFL